MSQDPLSQHQPPFDVPSVEEMAALLPQYAFEKLAAFGGMGAVYRARQISLDRPVAIKILPPEFGQQEDFAERFKSEARAMAKLNHTHIVGVYDFGITREGHLYLVMEWVEGQTLHTLIQQGCVPVRKAAKLAMQLCDALAFAHNHKILHRDIKPGNIMISEDDQVKVADFGLARPITGEAEENPFGTPDYAAPEILGKGAVDQRADIFAAGVVLYEMLTGRVPQTPRRSVQEFAPLSPRWDELISKAVHPDPIRRFQDVGEFRAHIAMLVNHAAQAVRVVEVPGDQAKTKSTFKPLHLALIGGGVVAAIVAGLLFSGGSPPAETPKKKTPKKELAAAEQSAAEREKKAAKAEEQGRVNKKKQVVVQPVDEPVPPPPAPEKAAEPTPPAKSMTAEASPPPPSPAPVPEPSPPQPKMEAAVPPAPETPLQAIQNLEDRDPELVRLLADFNAEWLASEEVSATSETQALVDKYIQALQRNLPGLALQQRDFILSEISHLANHQPLDEPDVLWPAALKTLRKAYATQIESIQARSLAAAQKMRAAQCSLVSEKARERAAAGQADAAARAEVVAAELARLKTAPSLQALKQSTAGAPRSDSTSAAIADPLR